jgi:hypothetical protein
MTELGSPPATSAPGLDSPLPHLHRDWTHPLPHLHRDWAHRCHICTGTGLTPYHICTATLWSRGRASRPTLMLAAAYRLHGSSPLQQCVPVRPRLPPNWPCIGSPSANCATYVDGTVTHFAGVARNGAVAAEARLSAAVRRFLTSPSAAHGYPRAAAVACATRRGRAAVQGTLAGLG